MKPQHTGVEIMRIPARGGDEATVEISPSTKEVIVGVRSQGAVKYIGLSVASMCDLIETMTYATQLVQIGETA